MKGNVELYGTIRRLTKTSVLFRVSVGQPQGVPHQAIGLECWFPRRGTVLFRCSRTNNTVLQISRALLDIKLAESVRRPIVEIERRDIA